MNERLDGQRDRERAIFYDGGVIADHPADFARPLEEAQTHDVDREHAPHPAHRELGRALGGGSELLGVQDSKRELFDETAARLRILPFGKTRSRPGAMSSISVRQVSMSLATS